jgi:anti-sigma factor RsiW
MNSETQLKVQAYLDNELSPGEARKIANLLNSDAELRTLLNELKETKQIVSENEPAKQLPEGRDFYWSKIQREISKVEQLPVRPASPWWMRFMAPVAGAVALFAVLLSIVGPTDKKVALHEGQINAPDMSTITFRSEVEGVTVVWVSSNHHEIEADFE